MASLFYQILPHVVPFLSDNEELNIVGARNLGRNTARDNIQRRRTYRHYLCRYRVGRPNNRDVFDESDSDDEAIRVVA